MKRTATLLTLAALFATAGFAGAIQIGEQPMTYISSLDDTEQPYNLYVPPAYENGEPLPLVVVLHGLGSSWQTWFSVTTVTDWASDEGLIVVAPHGRGNWYYMGPGEQDVLDVIEVVQRLCRVDEDRIYLIGHSMGGWGTWQMGLSHPDLFAAIIPNAGWAPLELLPNAKDLPICITHGTADTVVPVERARDADAALDALGIDHVYLEIPAWGHHSALISHMLPVFGRWLLEQERSPSPNSLTLRTFTPRRGSAPWIQFLENEEFPRLARIDADAPSGENRIEITTSNVRSFAIDLARLPFEPNADTAITVNGEAAPSPLDVSRRALICDHSEGAWEFNGSSVPSIPEPAVVAQLEEAQGDPVGTVAQIFAAATGSDTGLLRTVYACPGLAAGPVTEDELLDLYLRAMDPLYTAEMTAATIHEITESGRNQMSPVVSLDDPDRVYKVALTTYLVRRLPEGVEVEPVGRNAGEVIYDYVRETGSLP
jgi:predicted esterase